MLAIPPSSSSALTWFTPPDGGIAFGGYILTFPWGPGSHSPSGGPELELKDRRGDLR